MVLPAACRNIVPLPLAGQKDGPPTADQAVLKGVRFQSFLQLAIADLGLDAFIALCI